ncbi:MAG: histidinol-phosphate aminotransferase family protein [Pseudomonadales bacterium]|nr:histidinol-phosphate aminotransferase family protein [Pseudomonadales bacterium]
MKKINKNNKISFKNLYAFGKKALIDLSLSENPLGCSPLVLKEFKIMNLKLNDYPDARLSAIKKALAKKFDLNEQNFFISNGSEAIIINLSRLFLQADNQVIIPKLTFPMFNIAAKQARATVLEAKMNQDLSISLDEVSKNITNKTKIIFICNPNNPTGNILQKSQIERFLKSVPQNILVVIDEANIEFGGESLISSINQFKQLIILRTFSKGFGLASLRIGFCVASEEIIEKLSDFSQPFPISEISEKLAVVALKDEKFLKYTKKNMRFQRIKMTSQLELLGFEVFPSGSNNLFIKIPKKIDKKTFEKDLMNAGISLVEGKNFSGFNNAFFRVSPRDEFTNKFFIKKISDIVGNYYLL